MKDCNESLITVFAKSSKEVITNFITDLTIIILKMSHTLNEITKDTDFKLYPNFTILKLRS